MTLLFYNLRLHSADCFVCLFVFPKSLKRLFYGKKKKYLISSSLFSFGKETNWKNAFFFLERKTCLFSNLNFSYGVYLKIRSRFNNWKVYPLPLKWNEILEILYGKETLLLAAVCETRNCIANCFVILFQSYI